MDPATIAWISGVGVPVAIEVIKALGSKGAKEFKETLLARVAGDVGDSFASIESVRDFILEWVETEDFKTALTEWSDGGYRGQDFTNLALSFERSTDFYTGERSGEDALAIIEAFMRALGDELLKTEGGLLVHDQKDEARFQTQLASSQRIELTLGQIQSTLESQGAHFGKPGAAEHSLSASEDPLDGKVSSAASMIQKGQFSEARSLLLQLKNEIVASTTSHVRYRIRANLGVCATQLSDFETASEELTAASIIEPENPIVWLNLAQLALFEDQPSASVAHAEKALELGLEDRRAGFSVLVQAYGGLGDANAVEQLILDNPDALSNSSFVAATGFAYMKLGLVDKAETALRAASADDPGDATISWGIAAIVAERVQEELFETRDQSVLTRSRSRLEEALTLLERATEAAGESNDRVRLSACLATMSAVQAMLDDPHAAEQTASRAIAFNPNELTGYLNRGFARLHLEDYKGAAEDLVKAAPRPGSPAIAALSDCYIQLGQPESARQLLLSDWASASPKRSVIAEMLLMVCAELDDHAEASRVLADVCSQWGDTPAGIFLQGSYHYRVSDRVSLVRVLDHLDIAEAAEANTETRQGLAWLEFNLERYREVLVLLAGLSADSLGPRPTWHIAVSQYQLGQRGSALITAASYRTACGFSAPLADIEALLLEDAGDLDSAIELRKLLIAAQPERAEHGVRLVFMYIRKGDPDSARESIHAIRRDALASSPLMMANVANAMQMLGMEGSLELAYEARRSGYDVPEAHLAYFTLFLQREQASVEDDLESVVAGPETAVQLREGEGSPYWRRIVPAGDEISSRDEVSATSRLGEAIVGVRAGQVIRLDEGEPYEKTLDVVQVQSKYVRAFQEVLEDFPTRFAGHGGIRSFSVAANDFSRLEAILDGRQRLFLQALTLYRSTQLPLGALAHLLGKRTIEVWQGLVVWAEGEVDACSPAEHDLEPGLENARGAGLVLDVSAILALEYVGLLDLLLHAGLDVFVPQAVIDEFLQVQHELEAVDSTESIAKHGEQITMTEYPASVRVAERERIGRIVDSLRRATRPAIVNEDVEPGSPMADARQFIGEAAYLVMAGARCSGYVLVSDDLALRRLARSDGTASICTARMLAYLVELGLLSPEDSALAVRSLVLANYRGLPVVVDDMFRTLDGDGKITEEQLEYVRRSVGMPSLPYDPAVDIAAEVLKRTWLAVRVDLHRSALLSAVMDGLLARGGVAALRALETAVRRKCQLVPTHLDDILQQIAAWRASRLL
jgi:tetratricopeptide (TPR) repeat protein